MIGNINIMIEIDDPSTQIILFNVIIKCIPNINKFKNLEGYPKYSFADYTMFSYYYNDRNNTYFAIMHFYNYDNKLMVGDQLKNQLSLMDIVSNEFIFTYEHIRNGASCTQINYIKNTPIINREDYDNLRVINDCIIRIKDYAYKPYNKDKREYYYKLLNKYNINYIINDIDAFKSEYLKASSKVFNNSNNNKLRKFVNSMEFNDFDCLVDMLIYNYEIYEYKHLF